MKIFRLSLFNLRKNKKEALAIIFLTFVTVFLLGTVAANIAKINTAIGFSVKGDVFHIHIQDLKSELVHTRLKLDVADSVGLLTPML